MHDICLAIVLEENIMLLIKFNFKKKELLNETKQT